MDKICTACKERKPLACFYRHKAYAGGYKAQCKDCEKIANKSRREADPEKYAQIAATYRANNQEKERLRHKIYEENNKEKRSRYKDKHRRANLAQYAAYSSRRRAGGKLNEHYSIQEWIGLCGFYEHSCLACGDNSVPMTVDHIVPLSKNGWDTIDNIQPLCKSCNSRKGNREIVDYRLTKTGNVSEDDLSKTTGAKSSE